MMKTAIHRAFLPTALPLAAVNAPLNTTDPRADISIETLKAKR